MHAFHDIAWPLQNNQVNAIKETLALGQLLGRTVVLPDVQPHYREDTEEAMRIQVGTQRLA